MALNNQPVRVGVDIGGTFTDVALEIGVELFTTKVLTDYTAPERAILKGLEKIMQDAKCDFSDIDVIIHGTTLATNALIERKGVKTALITTEGFRDVIEMRTENRFEQYDLDIVLPKALIDREHRYVLKERIDANGNPLIVPDKADIADLVEIIKAGSYESVAIGFLHSYANGEHEELVRKAIQDSLPEVSISISSEVSPQIREYERFNTVCANAYVKPLIQKYLKRLVAKLKENGTTCDVFMMHSGGGIISVETASEFPVRLVESGPAGGAIFAANIAERFGFKDVVSFDMGGTTAKICLIENYTPKTAKTFEVARTYRFKKGSGMPISIPIVEMVEIGAGGGSIASIDGMSQIRVGPHSAGSEPGPACYQRGGDQPTVTDANVALGKLDPDYFAGGEIKLSKDLAEQSIANQIGSKLGLSDHEAAYGILEVVDENMANAGRVHAVESGYDIRGFTMITFGGAGPAHAARLCEKMGMGSFVVPYGAGVGSALGFLRAPFGFEAARSGFMKLKDFDAAKVNKILASMEEEAITFARMGMKDADPIIERVAYMRYSGQGWEIPVSVPVRTFDETDADFLKDEFETVYKRFFGRPIDGLGVEIVSWSVRANSTPVKVQKIDKKSGVNKPAAVGKRDVYESKLEKFVESNIYDRDLLAIGDYVVGPAVIVERETATIIPTQFTATVQEDLCLLVTLEH